MTREEHIKRCKENAIKEYDFYKTPGEKQRNALTAMMLDLMRHPETSSPTLQALCMMQMMKPMTRQQFVNFINGFH